MEDNYLEVYFEDYCEKCKYEKTDENEMPCDACLSNFYNLNSHKPICFTEKKEA